MAHCSEPYWDVYYSQMNEEDIDPYDGWLFKYADYFRSCKKVLDLGCGAGTNIDALLEMCDNVYVADISAPALKLIDKKYNRYNQKVHICNFDMKNIFPYNNQVFDVVVADLSLHYFNDTDTEHIVHEIKRILQPCGVLIARVHSIKNLKYGNHPGQDNTSYFMYTEGFQRRYFTIEHLRMLFNDWDITEISEHTVFRYAKDKEIIELTAVSKQVSTRH